MPTGYTAELMEKGQSFEDFVLGCARAFGALVDLRDEPLTTEIPEFKPSEHFTEELAKSKAELAKLEAMTSKERIAYGEEIKEKRIKDLNEQIQKANEENKRLGDMIVRVEAWTPPSSEHENLKQFMLDQLESSMNNLSWFNEQLQNVQGIGPDTLYESAVEDVKWDIEYSEKGYTKEVDRVTEKNLWVKQLKESLQHEAKT